MQGSEKDSPLASLVLALAFGYLKAHINGPEWSGAKQWHSSASPVSFSKGGFSQAILFCSVLPGKGVSECITGCVSPVADWC